MITFGSDPEFMLKDERGNLKSAIDIIPGTKEVRLDLGDGHACFYDNVLAECSIRPGNSKEDSVESFRQCFARYAAVAAPYQLVPQASARYPEEECQHKEAKRFGCDPEFCGYEVAVVNPPSCTDTFRSGGGHIHIGYDGGADTGNEEVDFMIAWNRVWVVRMCDLFMGIPSLSLDQDPTSKDRRKLYGGAGTHRGCDAYGVEYRTLGNFWVARPSLVELMYDLSSVCAKLVVDDNVHERIWEEEIDSELLRQTINSWNTKNVAKFHEVIKRYVPQELWKRIETEVERGYTPDLNKQWGIKA